MRTHAWPLVTAALVLARFALAEPMPMLANGQLPRVDGPLSLSRAIELGRQGSLMVHESQADLRAARADTAMARSQSGLKLSANSYLLASDMMNVMAPAPGIDPAGAATLTPRSGSATANLALMAPISTGGRLGKLVRAAQGGERAAAATVTTAELDAALQVSEAYYRVLLTAETVAAARARVEAAQALEATTRQLVEAGKGIEASVARAQAETADAQRALVAAQTEQGKSLLDLKAAMGVSFDSDVRLTDTLAYAEPPGDLDARLAVSEKARPEIAAALARVAAAKAQVDAARAAYRPQVYAAAMLQGDASRNEGSAANYAVGLVVGVPLLDGGQRRAEEERARALVERSEADLAHMRLQTQNEIHHAWLDVQAAAQNYRTAQAGLTAAQTAYDVAVLRVQNQKGILVEQLDALAALNQARANVTQAMFDHALAVARLRRASGEVVK